MSVGLPGAAAALPAPYDRWIAQWLGELPQAESRATCADCVMCARPDTPPAPQRILFHRDTRCCTYQPHLPNFLVGALLAQSEEAGHFGRESVAQRIAAGDATLLGIRIDPAYLLLYRHASGPAFGRARRLRCPHMKSDGACGIWAWRPAVCATWFCKHERGALGDRLWKSIYRMLSATERVLSLWCLERLGVDAAIRREVVAEFDEGPPYDAANIDRLRDADRERGLWGEWWQREPAFYAACAAEVETLDWQHVQQIGGVELALLAETTLALAGAHADLALPERLLAGHFSVRGHVAGRLWLQSYSEFDPIEASSEVLAFIARCDGRPREAIVAEHAAHHGQRPTRLQIRNLLDFGILVAG